MAHILNRLVHGSASTFNKQTNVSLDNKYTVLDISSLTGDLLTVGMFVALDFVWDRAKADRTEEKTIFIDECWQLLSGAGATGTRLAGDFLLEIAKTIRGYGARRSSRAKTSTISSIWMKVALAKVSSTTARQRSFLTWKMMKRNGSGDPASVRCGNDGGHPF